MSGMRVTATRPCLPLHQLSRPFPHLFLGQAEQMLRTTSAFYRFGNEGFMPIDL